MPTKNNSFLNVLNSLDKPGNFINHVHGEEAPQDPRKKVREALDTLLKVDPSQPQKFRKAIGKHLGFWQQFQELELAEKEADHIDQNFLDENETAFTLFQQKVAEKRVLLGLQTAEEDIIVTILKNNPEECRAYLASKKSLGNLTGAVGWQPNLPNPDPGAHFNQKNTHEGILTALAITHIKQEAAKQLLIKKIKQSKEMNLLNALKNSSNKQEFEGAIIALGFPREELALSSLSFDEFTTEGNDIAGILSDKITGLVKEKVRKDYVEYIAALSPREVLGYQVLLEKADKEYLDSFQERFSNQVTENEVPELKGILASRYLQVYLATNKNKEELLRLINISDIGAMKEAIKELLPNGDKNYIAYAINKNTIDVIRGSMVEGVISRIADPLKLINARDLDALKKELQDLGVDPVDWVNERQMQQMQKAAHSRYFELAIAKRSNLGISSHSVLREAFKNLDAEKQLAIISNKNNELRHILNAQDGSTLKYYLGDVKPNSLIPEIIIQHQQGALFKEIHNAELAKILYNIKPPIKLDESQVQAINFVLNTDGKSPQAFATATSYKVLVDKVEALCIPQDKVAFYNQLGLNNDGTAFINPPPLKPIHLEIEKQQIYNAQLTDQYHPTREAGKKFLDVIMSVPKTELFTKQELEAIEQAFINTSTLADFIAKVDTLKPNDTLFLSGFTNQLSLRKYAAIQTAIRRDQLRSSNTAMANGSIKQLYRDFKALQKAQKTLAKGMDKMKPFLSIKPSHLFNPSFQGKAKNEAGAMRTKYQEMADESALAMDKLRRDQFELDGYLKSLPQTHPDLEVANKLRILREEIEKEIVALEERYQFYEKVQEKIKGKNGILVAIDEAVKGSKSYYYNSSEVKRHRYTISQGNPHKIGGMDQAGIPHQGGIVQLNSGNTLEFLLEDKLQPHQAIDSDYKYITKGKDQGGTPIDIETYARVTQTMRPDLASTTSVEKTLKKTNPMQFEIKKFPQPDTEKGQTDADVEDARMRAGFTIAKEILAKMDEPPSEKNKIYLIMGDDPIGSPIEMQYIWTALVLLGEKDPNMKFNMNAIELQNPNKFHKLQNSNTFNPKNEGGVTFGISHFSRSSLYKQVFMKKEHETLVSDAVKGLKELTEEKIVKKKESFNTAKESMQAMKSSVQGIKKSDEDKIKTEGVAPEVPPHRRLH